MVGLGVDLDDIAEYVGDNDLGTAVLLRALARSAGAAGAGVEHGRLRRGPLPLRRARDRAARARAPPDDLDAGRFEPPCPVCGARAGGRGRPARTRRSTRATSTRRRRSPRSTCAPPYARETGVPVTALRYHNVYGPRMPRDTPYAGVASIFRSRAARPAGRRACSRTAASGATSCTSATSPARTSLALRSRRRRARSTSPAARRAPWARWRATLAGGPRSRSRASGARATCATCSRRRRARPPSSASARSRTSPPGMREFREAKLRA